jgi:hypothetical protein
MRYLTKYKQFNESKIPDNFIELRSLEYTLDPNDGIIYPTLTGGNYDEDNGHGVGYDYREYVDISDEDIEIIETYYKSTEEVVKDYINWYLINYIKDISLDYLDKDYKLNIRVSAKMFEVYNEFFSHSENSSSYKRYFPSSWKKLMDVNKPENYYYNIRLLKPTNQGNYLIDLESSIDFVHELEKSFPELSDKITYSKW